MNWVAFEKTPSIQLYRTANRLQLFPVHEQYTSVRDNARVSILTKLKRLSTSHQIHLQWIPSHRDLEGIEIADTMAEADACELPEPSAPLTFLEIFSRTKHQNKTAWITPPEHHWYQCSRPGGSLAHGFT
ncbi:RNase H domain-containing protein [Trichonephila clavipes]|nr:RNase H domain-containing protein [Trichonephila clavipes]